MFKNYLIFFHDFLGIDRQNRFSEMGAKGAHLWEMTHLGLPVPAGFVLTASACRTLNQDALQAAAMEGLKTLLAKGEQTNSTLPFLFSVRSTSPISMPGMMDTILNLGLSRDLLTKISFPEGWQLYGDLITTCADYIFHKNLQDPGPLPCETHAQALALETRFYEQTGVPFPQDMQTQLRWGIQAVLKSWNNERAQVYRNRQGISPTQYSPAVIVQKMVFGHLNPQSGSGVVFTRHPGTGKRMLFGEYLPQSQGEKIVSGAYTPHDISVLLQEDLPNYKALEGVGNVLEDHFKDMQDIEFTIEDSMLWILQARSGKRSGAGALRIGCDMVYEGRWSTPHCLENISAQDMVLCLSPQLKSSQHLHILGKGLAASPGTAVGLVTTSRAACLEGASAGKPVIFVCAETSCDDVQAMIASQGFITARGGATCHASVVARALGKPCVTSLEELTVHENGIRVGVQEILNGSWITLDGQTGNVFLGKGDVQPASLTGEFQTILGWAREHSQMGVFANADTVADWKTAEEMGAQGIGLCRTEHMFFQPDRLTAFQAMILSQDPTYQEEISSFQTEDFKNLFRCTQGKKVIIRLLDPPLHEFFPQDQESFERLSQKMTLDISTLKEKVHALSETNPMLGQRGGRVGILLPWIYDLQVRSILTAVQAITKEDTPLNVGIMLPFIAHVQELKWFKNRFLQIPAFTDLASNVKLGVMIEVPSAALCADEIALEVDFLCFGTNDLTQMTLGLSRDDSVRFLEKCQREDILDKDPFQVLHPSVAKLMHQSCQLIRSVRPDIALTVCGEHGAEMHSINLFRQMGIDHVSCSPYRVPQAQLAVAQASLKNSS